MVRQWPINHPNCKVAKMFGDVVIVCVYIWGVIYRVAPWLLGPLVMNKDIIDLMMVFGL